MDWKKSTLIVILSILFAIIMVLIYDAIAIAHAGTEASISSFLIIASHLHPLIPLMIGLFTGILYGHLFWRMAPNKDTISSGIDKL